LTVWCWVRSTKTGHRFDVPLQRLDHLEAIGAVAEIPGRRREHREARRPKHFVGLDGRRATPATPAARPADTEE
jgi:hypothetical protein